MRYLCLGYGGDTIVAAFDASAELRSDQCIVAHGLEPAESAASVRVRGGKVLVASGPVAATLDPLIGFCVIEARDLNDAIHAAARIPAARVGSIEVRPVRPERRRRTSS